MSVDNIIVMLLFIIPGIISRSIAFHIGYPTRTNHSSAMEIVYHVMESLPILGVSVVLMTFFWKADTLTHFMVFFDNMRFILGLSGFVVLLSILTGFFSNWILKKWLWLINFVRVKKHVLPMDNEDGWKHFLHSGDNGTFRFMRTEIGGRVAEGFLVWSSFSHENHEVILSLPEHMKELPDTTELFPEAAVLSTYIDTESGYTIKEYSCENYTRAFNERYLSSQPTELLS